MKNLLKVRENLIKNGSVFHSTNLSELRIIISNDTVIDVGNTVDCQGKFGVNVERDGRIAVRGCSDIYQITEFGFPQDHDKRLAKTTVANRVKNPILGDHDIEGDAFMIRNSKQPLFPTIVYNESGDLWIEPRKGTRIVCEGNNPYSCKVERI